MGRAGISFSLGGTKKSRRPILEHDMLAVQQHVAELERENEEIKKENAENKKLIFELMKKFDELKK